jgi:hypothetical protein
VSLYADDLVLLVAQDSNDLHCIAQILQLFAGVSGLVTNMEKCVATPIRCTEEMVHVVQQAFPCFLAPFPCRYLGIPLSLARLGRAEKQALEGGATYPCWARLAHQSDALGDPDPHQHSLLFVLLDAGTD